MLLILKYEITMYTCSLYNISTSIDNIHINKSYCYKNTEYSDDNCQISSSLGHDLQVVKSKITKNQVNPRQYNIGQSYQYNTRSSVVIPYFDDECRKRNIIIEMFLIIYYINMI